MRLAGLVALALLAACGGRATPPAQPSPTVPRLLAPPLIDPAVRGSGYLTAVALSLQPAWRQFLEDCRLRLPVAHPLNRMDLATTAELAIGKRGELVELRVVPSGNTDFDHAIEQVVRDATPLPSPPRELWSDDDQVHLAWTFARDRRQAGPATAQVIDVELPLRGVVDRRIGEHDLARAARRILRDKPGGERELATERLMIAALREALDSSDGQVRRSALDAIRVARTTELKLEVRQLHTAKHDIELRLAAMTASAELKDEGVASVLFEQLVADRSDDPRLMLAGTRALVAVGGTAAARRLLELRLAVHTPNPVALHALALAPDPALRTLLPGWMRATNPRLRAGVCAALVGYRSSTALPLLARGLADRDASVRAACVASAVADAHRGNLGRPLQRRIVELARDRDTMVRASAVRALGLLAPAKLPGFVSDSASEVRAACAQAIGFATADAYVPQLRLLIADRDPDVRAAAWEVLGAMQSPPSDRAALAADAAKDPAPQARLAAIASIDDDEVLEHLATADDAGDVRTGALVKLAHRRGRAAIADLLLQRLAGAAPGGAERVRTARAWLLAR